MLKLAATVCIVVALILGCGDSAKEQCENWCDMSMRCFSSDPGVKKSGYWDKCVSGCEAGTTWGSKSDTCRECGDNSSCGSFTSCVKGSACP